MGKVLEKVRLFAELVKFEHSVFALPYAYVGALYGAARSSALPSWSTLVWITVVMVSARSFAFVLNRAIDKEIDARNPRTAGRAVPAGLVKAAELWLFASVMLALYVVGVWKLAPVVRPLAPIPLIAFTVYPYTKRFTRLCHYWLGMCLGLAPVGAWLAVGASPASPAPWLMGLAVTLWTAGFDIIYATQDVECDRRDGIHSMPADIGIGPALAQTRILHVLTVVLLAGAGFSAGAGPAWFAGVAVAGVLLFYENAIVSAEDLSRVDAAFFTTNGVIAIVLFSGAIADRLMGV